MAWMNEHGIISGLADYLRLPLGVLEDARAWMKADLAHLAKEAQTQKGYPRGKRR